MKLLIKTSTFVLVFTGLLLTEWALGSLDIAIWVHLLLGFGYTVLFLLFSFDHISGHWKQLTVLNLRNVTGVTQSIAGGVTLASGFVLYLYGSKPLEFWTEVHLYGTLVFLGSVLVHVFNQTKKTT